MERWWNRYLEASSFYHYFLMDPREEKFSALAINSPKYFEKNDLVRVKLNENGLSGPSDLTYDIYFAVNVIGNDNEILWKKLLTIMKIQSK
ncbi:MAG: hypothetical protein mread185_000379 [Mycoplasmataceae bacterium]|nr:MAG: hypothetical protein mread185_000379 [Mycoplasmataceae bacterium]